MHCRLKERPYCRACGKPIAKVTHWIKVYASPPPDYTMEAVRQFEGGQLVTVRHEKRAVHVPRHVIGEPNTIADCQALTRSVSNSPVMVLAIRRSRDEADARGKRVREFSIWDGETYEDEFFCSGSHAQQYAYAMARAFPQWALAPWHDAMAKKKPIDKA